jgi:polyisoprenyl-teichoic acid--peptidoglycan teichoic acid transferase
MKKAGILFLTVIAVTVGACSIANQSLSPHASLAGRNAYVIVAPPGSSPTPTPFQPIPPTPTYIPTSIEPEPTATPIPIPPTPIPVINFVADQGRSWQDYPGPSVWPDIDIPAPVGILSHPEDQVNILLLGSDQRPNDSGFRTDTIQLLTINPTEKTAKLTSFPRDLYVYIPGDTVQRINTAMGWGGFEALAETMEYNLGVKPDYYVLINFGSFKDVIDSIGGIRVDIGKDFCDHRDAFGWYCVSASEFWMDGESALWYVRARYSTSDLDRGRRQQEVLDAVFDKLMSMDSLQHAPELYDIYKQDVTTNLDFDTLSRFIPVAYKMAETHGIQNYSIGAKQVYNWTTTSGAMVLVPVRDQVLDVMRQVISEP